VRRRAPRPLAAALEHFTAGLEPATVLAGVQAVWAASVGEAVAAHCTPVGERGGVLEVACDESVWAAELELMGPEVADQLSASLGRPAITALRCRTDPSKSQFKRH
jgi:predicted nucleic acid-binding Zn ribbon protein